MASWLRRFVSVALLALSLPAYAAETMTVGPVPVTVRISGAAVSLPATVALRAETLSKRANANLRLTLPLDGFASAAPAIAVASGLANGSCDGNKSLAVSVNSGQVAPAEPALDIALNGTVRAWLCRPIKTAMSPTVPVALRGRASVTIGERHALGLSLSEVRLEIQDGSLGPARGFVQGKLKSLADKLQADVNRDLAAKRLVLDDLLAPASVSKAEARFAGTALVVEVEASLPKDQAATLLAKLAGSLKTP